MFRLIPAPFADGVARNTDVKQKPLQCPVNTVITSELCALQHLCAFPHCQLARTCLEHALACSSSIVKLHLEGIDSVMPVAGNIGTVQCFLHQASVPYTVRSCGGMLGTSSDDAAQPVDRASVAGTLQEPTC